MYSAPLFESSSRIGKGKRAATSSIASRTQTADLFLTDRLMVQPVAISVMVGVKQNSLLELSHARVDLDEARMVLGPFGPGANWYLALEEGLGLGVRATLHPETNTFTLQVTIDGGGTHRAEQCDVIVSEHEVSVA